MLMLVCVLVHICRPKSSSIYIWLGSAIQNKKRSERRLVGYHEVGNSVKNFIPTDDGAAKIAFVLLWRREDNFLVKIFSHDFPQDSFTPIDFPIVHRRRRIDVLIASSML